MEQNAKGELEKARSDKIKSLGFLCYNLCVDEAMAFPEMNGAVAEIRKSLGRLMELRESNAGGEYVKLQEAALDERLTELGCICYNLYVDGKLFNSGVLALCDSISAINGEIALPQRKRVRSEQRGDKSASGVTSSKLKINCPYGMEPIPTRCKPCGCGYRNRFDAKYCARCGARLYA